MRLWLRLTLVVGVLAIAPLVLTGALAVRAASESATVRPEEQMSRDASTLATFVGTWVDAQARTLEGWQRVWDVRNKSEDHRLGLLRAAYQAIDAAVTIGLVDVDGRPVVPAVYLPEAQVSTDRIAGSDARVRALLARVPKRVSMQGIGIGDPYLPPGGAVPVVPIVAGLPGSDLRMVAEISLGPIAAVFADRRDSAAVLVDGIGKPVLGADHELLAGNDLDAMLDLGIDMTFELDTRSEVLQGAVWSVPYTEWKVVVIAAPSVSARAAAAIRRQTVLVAGLAMLAVVMLGLVVERTITRSVLALKRHAELVTKGAFGERNLVDRGDEIGDLGLALNVMSNRLEYTNAELRAFQEELQDRVAARTAELQRAQSQLVRAGQIAAVAQLGAGLAHELNNPLAALLGQVQLLRAGLAGDEDAAIARIEGHAERMGTVVEDMVRLASGDVGDATQGTADLREAVRASIEQVRDVFEQKGVAVVADPGSESVAARVAPDFAARLVGHLLAALCAGLESGASLRVGTERSEEGAVVWFLPDRPVAVGASEDDWRAAGMRLWAARGLIDLAGGEILEPTDALPAWRAVFPEAT